MLIIRVFCRARYEIRVCEDIVAAGGIGIVHEGGHSKQQETEFYGLANLRFRFGRNNGGFVAPVLHFAGLVVMSFSFLEIRKNFSNALDGHELLTNRVRIGYKRLVTLVLKFTDCT